MKGLFIPDITAEMFRSGCLESIEALMAKGEIYDIDYEPDQRWIPCKERMPYIDGEYLITKKCFGWNCKKYYKPDIAWYGKKSGWHKADEVIAWCELPEPYKEDPCNGCVYLGESCVGEGCWKLTERKEGEQG